MEPKKDYFETAVDAIVFALAKNKIMSGDLDLVFVTAKNKALANVVIQNGNNYSNSS